MTREQLSDLKLIPNRAIKSLIEDLKAKQLGKQIQLLEQRLREAELASIQLMQTSQQKQEMIDKLLDDNRTLRERLHDQAQPAKENAEVSTAVVKRSRPSAAVVQANDSFPIQKAPTVFYHDQPAQKVSIVHGLSLDILLGKIFCRV